MPIELGAMAVEALEKVGEEAVKEAAEATKGFADFGKTGLESGIKHVNFGKTGLENGVEHVNFGKTGLENGVEHVNFGKIGLEAGARHDIFGNYIMDSTRHDAFGIENAKEVTTGTEELTSKSVFDSFGFDPDRFLRETAIRETSINTSELSETNVLLQELRNGEFKQLKKKFWDDKKCYSRLYRRYYSNPNCYCFACDFPENPITGEEWSNLLNPGKLSGATYAEMKRDYYYPILNGDIEGAKFGLQKWIREDFKKVGKELVEVNADYVPNDGETMIYMCGCSSGLGQGDFHFMRKGNYGTWYHKPGRSEPLDRDEITGERIFDPEEAAKNGLVCYDMNLGYYVIRNI